MFSSGHQTPPPTLCESFSKKKLFFALSYGQINDPSVSNTWPLKSYTIQNHSTVSEFCSRLGELRENSSSARSCVLQGTPPEEGGAVSEFCRRLRELRENSSSARSCVLQGTPPERPPNEGGAVSEFCSRLGELRENFSSARSCVLQGTLPERPPNECPSERPPSPNRYSTASEFRSGCGY